jgi:cyclophilin family peptidyl-prolyl cis-trans isomerase
MAALLKVDAMLPIVLQGNKFHRIVSGFCCQGGDVVRGRWGRV